MNGAPQTPTIARPRVNVGNHVAQSLGAADGVELVAALQQTGSGVEVVVGAEGDDEDVGLVNGRVGRHPARLGVDGDDRLAQQADTRLDERSVGQADVVGLRAAEHHVQLGVAEHERVIPVDQRDAGVVAERLGQQGRELQPAEARPEDDDARLHRRSLTALRSRHSGHDPRLAPDRRTLHHRRMAVPAVVARPDLLEREQVVDVLRDALAATATGRGRLVLVAGEAGIGKTAVARMFCDEQPRPGRAVWGACDPLFTPRPLGPLLTIGEDMGGELKDVLASEAMPHEVVTALVHGLRADAPSVLVLEDVHWADEATLDVLRLLARRLEPIPAVVVATYRDAELHPKHPLRIMIGELATSRAVERVRLEPLSPRAVAQLAEPYGADADELYRKTAGNPFFVVAALAAGGQEIPDTVRDAVLARAARLSDRARRLLEAVAVVPPRAEPWLLTALVDDAVECVDECLTSGMLDVDPNGIAFRHELGRLAVENSIAPTRKLELHRRALAALADPPNGSPDLALLAHHAEAAGDGNAVLRFAPEAAVRAATLGAHREAVAQYGRALRFGDDLPLRERAELLERCAGSCFVTDQYDTGIAALEEALDVRRKLGDRLEEGDVLRRLSEFLWCPGRTAESSARAREAVSLLESLPPGPELGWAYANLAGICAAATATHDALAWGRRALELAERLGDEAIAASALATIGVSEGSNLVEASLDRARRAGNVGHVSWALFTLGRVAVEERRHAEARRHLDAGLAYAREHGHELSVLYLLASRARLELNEGRWTEAVETATSVVRVPRTSTKPRILALVVLGLIRARRGDPRGTGAPRRGAGPGRADRGARSSRAGRGSQSRGRLAPRRP